MISICFPSRSRVHRVKELLDSIEKTAAHLHIENIEVLIGVDKDDPSLGDYQVIPHGGSYASSSMRFPFVHIFTLDRSPRTSDYHNYLAKQAKGDILLYCGDDIVFTAKNWDVKVEEHFAKSPDKIMLVYHADRGQELATHGFVSKRSVEILGRLLPGFRRWYHDNYMTSIYKAINRLVQDPTLGIIHKHHLYVQGVYDDVYALQYTKDEHGKRPIDYDGEEWPLSEKDREEDVKKLTAAIAG